MFWADDIAKQIKDRYADKIAAGKPIVIRDEKTASGRVHVGSLRGVAIHGVIFEILKEQGIPCKYLFEINDFSFTLKRTIFDDKHLLANNEYNKWIIDPTYIKSNFDKNYYVLNKDGSINLELVLYFVPQNYFYFGSVISLIAFICGFLFIRKKNEKN